MGCFARDEQSLSLCCWVISIYKLKSDSQQHSAIAWSLRGSVVYRLCSWIWKSTSQLHLILSIRKLQTLLQKSYFLLFFQSLKVGNSKSTFLHSKELLGTFDWLWLIHIPLSLVCNFSRIDSHCLIEWHFADQGMFLKLCRETIPSLLYLTDWGSWPFLAIWTLVQYTGQIQLRCLGKLQNLCSTLQSSPCVWTDLFQK